MHGYEILVHFSCILLKINEGNPEILALCHFPSLISAPPIKIDENESESEEIGMRRRK